MLTEEKIWNYLDNRLSPDDRKKFEEDIAANEQAATLFQEISALQNELQRQPLMSPSLSFTDHVMASINASPVTFSIKPYLLFALPTLVCVVGLIVLLAYSNVSFSDTLSMLPLPQIKHLTLYFVVADVFIFWYFIEQWLQRKRSLPTISVLL